MLVMKCWNMITSGEVKEYWNVGSHNVGFFCFFLWERDSGQLQGMSRQGWSVLQNYECSGYT